MNPYRIRAHHGMCLAFFIGKGYSSSFVENMSRQKEYLDEKNPLVQIIAKADSICEGCPNHINGNCDSIEKVSFYDQSVMNACEIQEGIIVSWNEYKTLVNEKVMRTKKRKNICHDCEWNSICEKMEEQG